MCNFFQKSKSSNIDKSVLDNRIRIRLPFESSFWISVSGCKLKAASHRIRLRLTIRLMANGSLHTSSVGRVRVNFLGFDRLPAYLKLF